VLESFSLMTKTNCELSSKLLMRPKVVKDSVAATNWRFPLMVRCHDIDGQPQCCGFQRDQSTGQLDLADVIRVPSDENFSPAGLAIGNDSRTIIVGSEDFRQLYRFQIVEQPKQ